MTNTQSSALANPAASFTGSPLGPINGTVCAAAVITAPWGSVCLRILRNARKLAVSCGRAPFPACAACAGYSQSRSTPSSAKSRYVRAMLVAKVWRFCAVETAAEKYLQAREGVGWGVDVSIRQHTAAARERENTIGL